MEELSIQELFGDGTFRRQEALLSRSVTIARDPRDLVCIQDGQVQLVNPAARDVARSIIFRGRKPGETNRDYARRLGITPQELSMYVTEADNFRLPTRNKALLAMLNRQPVPDTHAVNHMLMELGHPGLYMTTYSKSVNRRNGALLLILNYAQRQSQTRDWPRFAAQVLTFLGAQPLSPRSACPPDPADLPLLQDWREQLAACGCCDPQALRLQYRAAFACRQGIDPENCSAIYEALERVSCGITLESISRFFQRTGVTGNKSRDLHASRLVIVEMGIAMGCSLDEINQMLLEADYDLLYPRSFYYEDIYAISRIQKRN